MIITKYIITTGEITQNMNVPIGTKELQCLDGEGYVEGEYDSKYFYYSDNGMTDRPEISLAMNKVQIIANMVDASIISGIPSGAKINWNYTEQIADGSDIEFVTDIIGEHKLQITLWPYQDAEVTINAI